MITDAAISDCGRYRHWLTRVWDNSKNILVFVMLNPSTADATKDDPTIRRCMRFAKRDSYGGVAVINLFDGRATSPDDLFSMSQPSSDKNKTQWLSMLSHYNVKVVCAWGADKRAGAKADEFIRLAAGQKTELWCLGVTKDGAPRHPLYLKNSTPLERFKCS